MYIRNLAQLSQLSLESCAGTCTVTTRNRSNAMTRDILFFDLDNCLYPKSLKIHDMMSQKIHAYIVEELHLEEEIAAMLQREYYTCLYP